MAVNSKTSNTLGQERFVIGRDQNRISVLCYPSLRKNAPLLVDVHGGGFVGGHHYDDDQLCSLFNRRVDINVVTIDYHYAPAVVYPTSTYDCFDALVALCEDAQLDFDREQIFLLGHSAGGNIVAGVSLLASGKIHLCGQILDYPFLNAMIDPRERKYIVYSIPAFMLMQHRNKYFPDRTRRSNALASPVNMTKKEAAGMPPTMVITCGRDSLREDGLRYVDLLKNAGADVRHIEYQDAVHGFIETVSNDTMKKSWWLPRKLLNAQKELFEKAIEEMCAFIGRKSGE